MQNSHFEAVVAEFMNRLSTASESVLLLDYDGTLAPFHKERDRAYPYPGVLHILESISRCDRTRVAIISGRPVREIQALLTPFSNLEIWGAHGLEHLLVDGTYQLTALNPNIAAALAQATKWLDDAELSSMAEIKPGGIAIHWRGLPYAEIERLKALAQQEWVRIARQPGLKLLQFDGGVELRTIRPDKGDAVAAVLNNLSFEAPIAFLGDDLTDEDAFRVLDGHGLSILVRSEYRKTRANVWLRPPRELIDFLERWSRAISR